MPAICTETVIKLSEEEIEKIILDWVEKEITIPHRGVPEVSFVDECGHALEFEVTTEVSVQNDCGQSLEFGVTTAVSDSTST